MDAVIRLANNFMDHREFDDIAQSHHYPEFICFEQVFHLLHDKVVEVMGSEDEYSPEHIKFMTLLLLVRSIYNGEISFSYHEFVYNGVPFAAPYDINTDIFDFKAEYQKLTGLVDRIESLQFDQISAIVNHSHIPKNASYESKKILYGLLRLSVEGKITLLEYFQFFNLMPFVIGDKLSTIVKRENEQICIQQKNSDIQIDFEYIIDNNKLLTIANLPDKICIPYDGRFSLYQDGILSHYDSIDIYIVDHFYLFLLCNGINFTSSLQQPFQNYPLNCSEMENEIEQSIERAIDFLFHSTVYRIDIFEQSLVSISNERILKFFQSPFHEFYRDLEQNTLPVNTNENELQKQTDVSKPEYKKWYRAYEDITPWLRLRMRKNFYALDAVLFEAAIALLDKANDGKLDTVLIENLWKERQLTPLAKIKKGTFSQDKFHKTNSAWIQDIKRQIDKFAEKHDIPCILKKETAKRKLTENKNKQ